MSRKDTYDSMKGSWRGGVMAVIAGVLAGVSLTITTRLISSHPVFHAKSPHATSSVSTGSNAEHPPTPDERRALAQSVVTIIQAYYVDADRVADRSLPSIVAAALKDLGGLSVDLADNILTITRDDATTTMALPSGETGARAFVAGVAEFLAEHPAADATPDDEMFRFLNAVLGSLDSHSAMLTRDEFEELRQGTDGEFGGLGIVVGMRDHLLTILKPIPNSPASRAGLRAGDRIHRIDGRDTYGGELEDIIGHLRGAPGTPVVMTIRRDGAPAPFDITLKRDTITVDSVTRRLIPVAGGTALHIKVEVFSSRTADEIREALVWARSRHARDFAGVILDLRSNPGGLLDQAVDAADIWIDDGVIVSTRGREAEIENANDDGDETDYPMTVLIDGDSASAAEILAGALQDHGRALVVGQPSFGKASVQTVFELPRDQALKLTIARYYTPSGRSIQNTGIMPDVWTQPLLDRKDNLNLLGDQRYKGERSLRHHLASGGPTAGAAPRAPLIKSYYLTAALHDADDDDTPATDVVDQELQVSLAVLGKNFQAYHGSLPDGARRAAHWLALSGADVMRRLDTAETKVVDATRRRFGIDWSFVPAIGKSPRIEAHAPLTSVRPGDDIAVAWTITPTSPTAIGRVSVFAEQDGWSFETREALVGRVGGESPARGTLSVHIPEDTPEGPWSFTMGVASDGEPLPGAIANIDLSILHRDFPRLTATANLDDPRGDTPGVLEPNERARLVVTLKNEGVVPITDVGLALMNLTGASVAIPQSQTAIKSIDPGESFVASFRVDGASMINANTIHMGIAVTGKDLGDGFHYPASFEARNSNEEGATRQPALAH